VAQSKVRWQIPRLMALVVMMSIVPIEAARAQSRLDCSTAPPLQIGVSAGRSSPYFDLAREVVDGERNASIMVRGGGQLGGRLDVPIAGPWRARVEGSRASWRVERQRYDDGFQLVASDTIGHVEARQVVATIGRQGGRSPLCGYVLAGGGIYSIGYRGARLTRPGFALTTGIEFPTGDRGAIQVDVQLHLIDTKSRPPVSGSAALAASLTAGWSFRF